MPSRGDLKASEHALATSGSVLRCFKEGGNYLFRTCCIGLYYMDVSEPQESEKSYALWKKSTPKSHYWSEDFYTYPKCVAFGNLLDAVRDEFPPEYLEGLSLRKFSEAGFNSTEEAVATLRYVRPKLRPVRNLTCDRLLLKAGAPLLLRTLKLGRSLHMYLQLSQAVATGATWYPA